MRQPSYVALLESGELEQRIESLMEMLRICRICPRDCDVDRLNNGVAACYSGLLPIVSAYTPHFGEEPALVGTHGAGNVFLGLCNLRCVYCQNYQISQTFKEQRKNEVSFERLAEMFLELQEQGCHNINWVSPTHFAPQLAKSLLLAGHRGLRLPVVYNTNAYDSVDVLKLLDGIVDVYLPDLKYSNDEAGREYSKVTEYVRHSRAAIKEMYRQMGDALEYDENGLLKRGLIIRLLVLPNDIAGIHESLSWIRYELSPKVAVSLMAQYFPTNKVGLERYPLISRKIRWSEWLTAVEHLESLGMEEGWMQDFDSAAEYYCPDFGNAKTPFRDILDFQAEIQSEHLQLAAEKRFVVPPSASWRDSKVDRGGQGKENFTHNQLESSDDKYHSGSKGRRKKMPTKTASHGRILAMKCPKCFNPLRRVASTEDSVWFTCPLGHRFHSETGSGISDSEGHRYAVSE